MKAQSQVSTSPAARDAERVTLIVGEPELSKNMSRYLIDQIARLANVRVLLGT
jgi:hypothetical protein